jgi:secreted trypsin-like serine protease
LGEHNIDEENKDREDHDLEQLISHKDYDGKAHTNDIALLKLKKDVDFKWGHIIPVCLPRSKPEYLNDKLEDDSLWIVGWGKLDFKNTAGSKIQQQIQIPVVTVPKCAEKYKQYGVSVGNKQLCAGVKKGGKDACQGDSGGPAVMLDTHRKKQFMIVGVVSFGYKCAEPGMPGIYTRVTSYLDWVHENSDVKE